MPPTAMPPSTVVNIAVKASRRGDDELQHQAEPDDLQAERRKAGDGDDEPQMQNLRSA